MFSSILSSISSSDTMTDFCGTQFFDKSLLNGDYPQFTLCFQVTVLMYIPAAFLLLSLLPYAMSTYNKPPTWNTIHPSWLYFTKVVVGSLAALMAFSDSGQSGQDYQAFIIGPLIRGAAITVTVFMIEIDRLAGRFNNGYLCVFWLIQILSGVIPFYSEIEQQMYSDYWHVSFYVQFAFWCIQFILTCFAEKITVTPEMVSDKHPIPCPLNFAPFFVYTTFQWLDTLMLQGWRKTITEEDLWELNPENKVKSLGGEFERLYKIEKAKKENQKAKDHAKLNPNGESQQNGVSFRSTRSNRGYMNLQESTAHNQSTASGRSTFMNSFLSIFGAKKSPKVNKYQPSTFKVLVKQFGPTIFKGLMFKTCYDCLQFCNPQILNLVITFCKSDDQPMWQGVFYSVLFFGTALLSTQFFHQLFYVTTTAGMNMKSALISAVYKKALVMSNEAKHGSTVGEIVNLMAIDSDRINIAVGYIWVIWSAPLQIIAALVFLWFQVQQAVFGGLVIILISVPINFFLASYQRRLQIGQLKFKDTRIRQMGEILNGMKVIKLYAWEKPFLKRISGTRSSEIGYLTRAAYLNGINTFTWTLMPFLVSVVTFIIYVYGMGQPLTANKAFVTLSLFNILRAPLNMLPMLIAFLVQASVSLDRISRFLNVGEIDVTAITHEPDEKYPLRMTNCDLTWSSEKDPDDDANLTLKNINLKVPSGSLTAIVGAVGAGKSSIVSSFLGDLTKVRGEINVHGDIAYVSQQAWIQNLTLRNNILFGKEYREDKYKKVIEACALKPDLEILPGGDQTEIGEKGINLSGGQKQRVNIARAVYQNNDIYLFDDPLSAVDSHVGKHLFENVIGPTGILNRKTRLLVTHGLAFLKHVDHVVFVKDGKICEQGKFLDLVENCPSFGEFVQSANLSEEDLESLDLDSLAGSPKGSFSSNNALEKSQESVAKESNKEQQSPTQRKGKKERRGRRVSRTISYFDQQTNEVPDMTAFKEAATSDKEREVEGRLIGKESSEEGSISLSVFVTYINSIGVPLLCLAAFCFLVYQSSSVFAQIWLSDWSDWTDEQISANPTNYSLTGAKQNEYAIIYAISGMMQAAFILFYSLLFSVLLVKASAKLHLSLLDNIMKCPMSFFDSVPSGRILNRFSKDIETTDNTLPQTVRQFVMTLFTVLQVFILISYTTPLFLVFLVPLCVIYYFIQRFYVKTSRQLKRVESTTRSPIFNHFSESITGTSVVRAYKAEDRFIQENCARVDENNTYYFAGTVVAARWLGVRLEFLGAVIVLASSLLAVLSRDSLDAGLVGLAVSSSLSVTGSLNWTVRMMSDLETYIVSVERIKEYTELENEAAWEVSEKKPIAEWPQKGQVAFKNYSTRYRADLDLVLKDISANISPGEKVGIVGRTGAGKSSLTLGLFRIIESAGGSIEIDDITISEIGLHDLRSKLTILPQDPVLFSGSLRDNIDPFGSYDDGQIWESLQNAHLKDFAAGLNEGLNYEVGEGGINLSVGQRQLVCLARALLHKTLVLILDEATAAVDLQTDALIQDTIRTEFKECTVLTIAHRLNTILDYDRVMVLSDGLIKEFDNPQKLLSDSSTQFYSMAVDAGIMQANNGTNEAGSDQSTSSPPPTSNNQ